MTPPPAEQPSMDDRIHVDPAEQASTPSVAEPSHATPATSPTGPAPTGAECRICLFGDHPENMVQPCHCTGSVQYAHLEPCLKSWVHERADLRCEICRSPYADVLLPELQPVLEQALKERARAARAHLPPLVIASRPHNINANDEDDEEEGINWRSGKFWLKVVIAILILGFIVSLLVFLGVNAGDAVWASVLLRVIAFGLPTFIVLRALISCWGVSRAMSEERRIVWAAGDGRV